MLAFIHHAFGAQNANFLAMQNILALDPVQLFQVIVGIGDKIQGNGRSRHGKGDDQRAVIEVIPQKTVGQDADVLDLREVDGVVVVFQENRFLADDDAVVGDNDEIEKIVDDLQKKRVDVQNGDDDGRKGEKGIEKRDPEHGDDGPHHEKKHEGHDTDQETENNRL